MESGSKKLFEYHGILSWVDDGGDYQSLDKIHDQIPQYFCTDNIIHYYLITVTAGRDNRLHLSVQPDLI